MLEGDSNRLNRIEDKLDNLTTDVIRLQENLKTTHELLIRHDASGRKALDKAEALEDRMDAQAAMWTVPFRWVKILAAVAGAVTAIWTAWKVLDN
jgi:hypothetical protein